MDRNVGIVGDGSTDQAIFGQIVECILSNGSSINDVRVIPLIRPTLAVHVERYWKEATRTEQYYLPGRPAVELERNTTNSILGAFNDFESSIGGVSAKDILLLTADAERSLSQPSVYFEHWALSISKILSGAVDKFYDIKANQTSSREDLPLVISLITFPSTDILVAAAKNIKAIYGKKPHELKRMLYGTHDLRTLRPEALDKRALKFITPESINSIYAKVPESRMLIQTLAFGKCLRSRAG